MKKQQFRWNRQEGWETTPEAASENVQLVFVFGGRSLLAEETELETVRGWYPEAFLVGCSTAGEIYDTEVTDDTLVVTALEFEKTQVRGITSGVEKAEDSCAAATRLAKELESDDLIHVVVISEGLKVNGSELVRGFREALPEGVSVTGGLSGDGANFEETIVLGGSNCTSGQIVAIGFYGESLRVSYASLGGWDQFGPERLVTRSEGNKVFEFDGRSALELYKEYLGEHASGLPGTGLLFPLSVRGADDDAPVVRTILAVDEDEQSITFAGDIAQGSYAQLMMANFDRLIDGAIGAANGVQSSIENFQADFALLISCVGRKMVLKQRIEEEVEGVREVLGDGAMLTGFYSYGEVSPFTNDTRCVLHNQTMTITAFQEV